MIIEDGKGSGISAEVTHENMIRTRAVTETNEHHVNQDEGNSYNALFAVNPDGADDVIFYLKNTDEKIMIIEGVWLQSSGAEEVYLKLGDTGTAVKTNGADITPVNLNAGSGHTADCLCYSNTADGAVDITGLTGGLTFQKIWMTAAADTKYFNFEQDLIIPKNQTFTIYCVGGDTNIRGTVCFLFHEA